MPDQLVILPLCCAVSHLCLDSYHALRINSLFFSLWVMPFPPPLGSLPWTPGWVLCCLSSLHIDLLFHTSLWIITGILPFPEHGQVWFLPFWCLHSCWSTKDGKCTKKWGWRDESKAGSRPVVECLEQLCPIELSVMMEAFYNLCWFCGHWPPVAIEHLKYG